MTHGLIPVCGLWVGDRWSKWSDPHGLPRCLSNTLAVLGVKQTINLQWADWNLSWKSNYGKSISLAGWWPPSCFGMLECREWHARRAGKAVAAQTGLWVTWSQSNQVQPALYEAHGSLWVKHWSLCYLLNLWEILQFVCCVFTVP